MTYLAYNPMTGMFDELTPRDTTEPDINLEVLETDVPEPITSVGSN
jgi:hypothetical protein